MRHSLLSSWTKIGAFINTLLECYLVHMDDDKAKFVDALRRLLRVPRHELEAEERRHAEAQTVRRSVTPKPKA